MADCACKAKSSSPQHENRIVIMPSPATGAIQTITPGIEKITDVSVIESKYTSDFDDTNYYSS